MIIPEKITKLVKWFFRYFGFNIYRLSENKFELEKKIEYIRIGGFKLEIDSTSPIFNAYSTNPNYSSELERLVRLVVAKYPNLIVMDIGANVGDTLAIIKNAADIPVICIEGDEYCFEFLQKNATQFHNVKLYKQYLGEFTKVIPAKLDKEGWNTTILPTNESEGFKYISLISLDDFFLKEKVLTKDIKILKTDAEGFDLMILRGGMNFISATRPVLYIEYNRDNMSKIGEEGLPTLLKFGDMGYKTMLVYDPAGRFLLSASIEDTQLIRQLHNYIDGHNSHLHYFDLCIFHKDDLELAESFLKSEELTTQ